MERRQPRFQPSLEDRLARPGEKGVDELAKQASVAVPDWQDLDCLLVGWPQRSDTWRDGASPARKAIMHFVKAVLKHTNTLQVIVVSDCNEQSSCAAQDAVACALKELGMDKARLSVLKVPMDDCWLRDTGPIFTFRQSVCGDSDVEGLCFHFNAWGGEDGGCYADYRKDTMFKGLLCEHFKVASTVVNMVLEGGSVSCDGQGTVITTKECLLNANRNPNLPIADVEAMLKENLAAERVIWLEFGAACDSDTDGHVDNMACFIRPGHVVLLWAEEHDWPEQHRRSSSALKVLQDARDAKGRRLVIHKVNAPPAMLRSPAEADGVQQGVWDARQEGVTATAKARLRGERLCASYVNFVVAEQAVFVPAFGLSRADDRAVREMADAFRGTSKRIVPVDSREFIIAGGGVHCLTLGVPKRLSLYGHLR